MRLSGVGVRYGTHFAVEGVDLEIRRGEILSLIGPNGAGKSTLLKVLAGLLEPSSGKMVYPGASCRRSYVPQQRAWDRFLPLTVMEFLSLQGKRQGWWWGGVDSALKTKAMACLEEMGVLSLANRQIGGLSGGESERMLIAFALLSEPEVLLLDEPLAGVDVKGGYDFERVIRDLNQRRGMAVVMVSHDLHLVNHLSQRVACLNQKIHCIGDPGEVMREHVLSGIYGLPSTSLSALRQLQTLGKSK